MDERKESALPDVSSAKLAKTSPTAITKIDRDGRIVYANEQAEEVLGLKESEITDRTYDDVAWKITDFEGNDFPKEKLPFQRVKETEEPVSDVRHAIEWPNGKKKYLSVNASPLIDDDGDFDGVVAILEDITEHEQLEEELKTSEKRYSRLFETAQGGMLILDAETGKIIDANPYIRELLGFSKKELVGKQLWQIGTFRDVVENKGKFQELVEEGYIRYEHLPLKTKSGEEAPVEFVSNTYMVDDKRVVQCNIRDITERKKAEEKLEGSEEKYRTIFESAEDAIFIMKEDRFVDCNEKTLEMFECEREDIVGEPPYEFSPEKQPDGKASAEKAKEKINLALEGNPQNFEWVHTTKDGEPFHAEVTLNRYMIEDEKFVMAIVRDITDRKEAKAELKKSESKFRAISEQAHDGLFIYRGDKFEWLNERTSEILGYSKKELYGKSIWDLLHPEDRGKVKEIGKKRVAGKEVPSTYEARALRKDGEVIDAEFAVSTIEYKGEQAVLGAARDVTERKKAEENLRENEKKYRQIFNNVNDAVLMHKVRGNGMPGNFVEVNDMACDLTGYTREELIDMSPMDISGPEAPKKVPEIMEELKKEGKITFERTYSTKDGTLIPVETSAHVFNREGEEFVLTIARDVTKRKKAQRKVEQRAKHERLLRQQSTRFLNCQGSELDTAIEDGLAEIGEFLGADRTYLFQFDSEREVTSNTYEWCREGIEPQKYNLQNIPTSSIPAWMDKLKDLENIHIPSVPDLPESWEAEREILEAQDIQSLVVVPVSYNQNLLGFAGFDAVREKRNWTEEEIDLLRVFGDLTGSALHFREMEEELRKNEDQLRGSFIELAETTSRVLGVRDPYTQKHEQRVAELAREVGERMGLGEDKLLGLYIGGVLHDIGKIAVPETVLTKPGELKDVEWQLIKSHPEVGYNQILADTDFPWPVAEMTLHHHERLDGSGYPDGLEGDELTEEVRILGAVDVVEAMSTRRPYREARSKERTLNVVKDGKGEGFDPEVVDILVEMIEEDEIEFGSE